MKSDKSEIKLVGKKTSSLGCSPKLKLLTLGLILPIIIHRLACKSKFPHFQIIVSKTVIIINVFC